MAAELLTDASRALDSNSSPYPGATWNFYQSGTLTPLAVYANADLSTSLGPVVTADAGGRFVPIYLDATQNYRGIQKDAAGNTITGMDIDPISVGSLTEFASAEFDTSEIYAGTGTATLGAPRWILGNLTPSGDDSALLLARNISGALLFSHAVRDESEFVSTGDSAYTSFDAAPTYKSNGGAQYNHGYQFQARPLMSATNGMDLLACFVSFPRVSAGTVDRLFHFHAQGWNKTGGTVSVHNGFYCSPLVADVGVAHAFYAESNPSFFGGYVQMDGDDLFGFGQARGEAAHFKGTVTSFEIGGGVFVGGDVTASNYAEIRAYEWDGTTLGLKGLALNSTGGQVLVGAGAPVTGEQLEVFGTIGTSDSYRVDGVKVLGNQGAAVADATDAASAITQLNALLARCRAHGLIA